MIETLAQVTGTHRGHAFACGIVLWRTEAGVDIVIETAPLLRKLQGMTREQARAYIVKQQWAVSVVHEIERDRPPWWRNKRPRQPGA